MFRRLLFGSMLCLCACNCSAVAAGNSPVLSKAVGDVLVDYYSIYERGTPPGGESTVRLIEKHYQAIKSLPERDRVRFLWIVLSTVDLDGIFLTEVHALIVRDCGDAFLKYGRTFLENCGGEPERELRDAAEVSRFKTELNKVGRMKIHYGSIKRAMAYRK